MFNRLFGKAKSLPPPLTVANGRPGDSDILAPFLQFFWGSFDRRSYMFISAKNACPTYELLDNFQQQNGFILPTDFRAFNTGGFCGFHLEVRPEIWPEAAPESVAPAWSFYRGLTVFGLSQVLPSEYCLLANLREMRDFHKIDSLLPFMQIDLSAERYCFTRGGEIVRWNPSTPKSPDKVDGSFLDVLNTEIKQLDGRRIRYQAGEHLK